MPQHKTIKKLFDFLSSKTQGDIIVGEEIIKTMDWEESTLKTYIGKNKLCEFLLPVTYDKARVREATFKVLQNGTELSQAHISTVFSQKNRSVLVISKDDEFVCDDGRVYIVESQLGNGAVGHVWRARLKDSNPVKRFAVKVVNPRQDLLKESVFSNVKDRFSREAENGMRLDHPNIIKYIGRGKKTGVPFLIMDLARSTLMDDIKKMASIDMKKSLVVLRDCLLGLVYLHENNHIHRDIKPHNILELTGGAYVLGDLGIVKWSDFSQEFISAGTLTRESIQLGSWYYMSPEQQDNPKDITPATDIYSLGVTWYHMLTGEQPMPTAIAAGRLVQKNVDGELFDLIKSMVNYEPTDRPTAGDLLSKVIVLLGQSK